MEYELLDTGVFDGDRYFDVFVEYAKASPRTCSSGSRSRTRAETATLHLLPTLWCRNTWSWTEGARKPRLAEVDGPEGARTVSASHPSLGERWLYVDGSVPLLFTENETNLARIWNIPNVSPFVKDGIGDFVIHGRREALNSAQAGTKMAPTPC